jgi:flagellar protein FlbD
VIAVTRLDDSTIFINVELIQSLQATPDTVITLVTKERMIVKESVDEVSKRICEYQRSIHNNPFVEGIMFVANISVQSIITPLLRESCLRISPIDCSEAVSH